MNYGIILSGGTGTRLGAAIPKQYIEVGGRPIILYSTQTLLDDPHIDALVVCLDPMWKSFYEEAVATLHPSKPIYYSEPGEVRHLTLYNALLTVERLGAKADDVLLFHDAARPLLSHELIGRCMEACREHDGAMPVIPVKDTTYMSKDGLHISALLNRAELFAGQAPEAFRFGPYMAIHKTKDIESLKRITGTTQIAYEEGLDVLLVKGDEMNFKITTAEDLSNFESIVGKKA